MNDHKPATAGGFTLTETLVVIAIIVVLAAFMISVIQRGMTKSKLAASGNNLRQLAVAVQLYATDHASALPTMRAGTEPGEPWGGPFWTDQIRPYFQMDEGKHESVFFCPLEPNHHPSPVLSDYGNNPFLMVMKSENGAIRLNHLKNPSNIILFAMVRHVHKARGEWFIPRLYVTSPDAAPTRPHDRGSGTIMTVFVDGQVKGFTPSELDSRARELFVPE